MKSSGAKIGDYVICYAVSWYCVISLFLTILMKVNILSMENQTSYRVMMTAIPMSIAIIIGIKRKPTLFIISYLFVIAVLIITIGVFPENQPFVVELGTRFLLPVCLSSALCLMSVYEMEVLYKSLKIVAYVAFFLALLFFVLYMRGLFFIDDYSMNFSYSCLLPMLVLYNEKKKHSIFFSIFLFLMVIAIGSRGAAVAFLGYVVYDLFFSSNKKRWWVLLLGIIVIVLLPSFGSFLSSIGITSRTLSMIESNDITNDTGRNFIQSRALQLIAEHPFGLGIYGDRANIDAYCHNIVLELMVDFGWIIGGVICLYGFFMLLKIYKMADKEGRNYLVLITMVGLFPFFFSGSVFQSAEPWWVIGYSVLLYNNIKTKRRIKNEENRAIIC